MKILLVGSGAREEAIAWGILKSDPNVHLISSSSNGGLLGQLEIAPSFISNEELVQYASEKSIDFVVIGPEKPLVEGLVDLLKQASIPAFGPFQKTATLEGSKSFMKNVLDQAQIPTASYQLCYNHNDVFKAMSDRHFKGVIKVDGLASGKGVYVCDNKEQTLKALKDIYELNRFKQASHIVIVEDILIGEEISIFAFTDGKNAYILPPSQDHKRVFDQDQGPNTGGMGAYAPSSTLSIEEQQWVAESIIHPVLHYFRQQGSPYKGVLYAGLMKTPQGIKVLEFNVRLGDPEAQCIIPLLIDQGVNLISLFYACQQGTLSNEIMTPSQTSFSCVVLASENYPLSPILNRTINFDSLELDKNSQWVFHGGTKKVNSNIVTSGGRVLSCVAKAETIQSSLKKVYQIVDKIHFEGCHYRSDIGHLEVKRKEIK